MATKTEDGHKKDRSVGLRHSGSILRQSKWFRAYTVSRFMIRVVQRLLPGSIQEFSLPYESFDVVFVKEKIVIPHAKGFEIMNTTTYVSVTQSHVIVTNLTTLYSSKHATVPRWDDVRQEKLAKRCASCRPVAIFCANRDELLLCYDGELVTVRTSLHCSIIDMRRIRFSCQL